MKRDVLVKKITNLSDCFFQSTNIVFLKIKDYNKDMFKDIWVIRCIWGANVLPLITSLKIFNGRM